MSSSNQDRSVTVDGDSPDILKRLEAYGSLVSECNRYALLARNAERNRHTVRPHIYARVKEEYEERSQTLEQEQQEQKEFLRTELEKILEKRRTLNELCRKESDRLEELDFRVRVGEYPEEEVQESRTKLKEDLLEITKSLAETQEVVRRFEQVGLLAQSSALTAGEGEGAGDEDGFLVLEEDRSSAEEDSPVVNGSSSFHEDVFGYLVALDGSRRGERFPLIRAEMTVGSSPDIDVHLADSGIARLHARIVYRDGRHFIETVEKPGSCRVNGVKQDKAELKDGDVLSLGKVKMQVEYAREANA
jgi:hypothetical protein